MNTINIRISKKFRMKKQHAWAADYYHVYVVAAYAMMIKRKINKNIIKIIIKILTKIKIIILIPSKLPTIKEAIKDTNYLNNNNILNTKIKIKILIFKCNNLRWLTLNRFSMYPIKIKTKIIIKIPSRSNLILIKMLILIKNKLKRKDFLKRQKTSLLK